jgi:glycosyltransferase involved in cell wall biosynthesis
MKIVYIHQYFRTRRMSGGTRSLEMARRLVRMGHEVDLVTSDNEPPVGAPRRWRVTTEEGIRVHWYPLEYSNAMSFSQRIRSFLRFAWKSSRRAAGIPADVVFATSTPLTVAIPGAYAAWRQGAPMVFEVRDLWPDLAIVIGALKRRPTIAAARALERFAYRRAKHIVALSPGMKAGVVRAGVAEDKVTVIPNGCDLDLFPGTEEQGQTFRASFPWLGNRPLVVYAGALAVFNDLRFLVHVAAEMRSLNREVRFLIIGQGNDSQRVRDLAADTGVLENNLYFLNRVAKEQMPAVLAAATMPVSTLIDVPGTPDSSPNKVFDALSAGRPIAINYGGWLSDILNEHDCGLVLPPQDIPAAARRIAAALADPKWLREAGKRARHVAETQFSRDQLAARLEAVLLASAEPTQSTAQRATSSST